jgi:type VI secretion system secreted protein Hcp
MKLTPAIMKRNWFISTLLLATLTTQLACPAAVDYFLKIDGIEGESVDAQHRGEVELLSFSWGLNQPSSSSGSGSGAGKVIMQDFHFTRRLDKASPLLMRACATGQHIPSVVLVCRKSNGSEKPVEYYKITLTDVLVSSVSTGGSTSDDRPTESVSFNFTKIEWEYVPVSADGQPGEPVRAEYDSRLEEPAQ